MCWLPCQSHQWLSSAQTVGEPQVPHFGVMYLEYVYWVSVGNMLKLHSKCAWNLFGRNSLGTCYSYIQNVHKMYLVGTCQRNGSCPFNVPDMFPPVSKGPHPQCDPKPPSCRQPDRNQPESFCWRIGTAAHTGCITWFLPEQCTTFGEIWVNFGNTAGKHLGNWKTRDIQNVPSIFPKFTQILPKVGYCGGSDGYIPDVPLWFVSGTLFWLIFSFTGQEHHGCTTGETAKNSLNEPLRNIAVTFFDKLGVFPIYYLIGTFQSHDLEYWMNQSFFGWENCREIGRENSECICDVPGGYMHGTLSISLWCNCNVPAWYTGPYLWWVEQLGRGWNHNEIHSPCCLPIKQGFGWHCFWFCSSALGPVPILPSPMVLRMEVGTENPISMWM